MEKLGGIIWDTTKYLFGRPKQEAHLIWDLEENLQSLEAKWERLQAMKMDVEAQIEVDENTSEMQRTHQVTDWLKSVQHIQEEIKVVQVKGAQEIQNKRLSKCCPKNCMSSHKLGKDVVKMLTEVDVITTRGQKFGKDLPITHERRIPTNQIPFGETVGLDLIFNKDGIILKKIRLVSLVYMEQEEWERPPY
ncbi:probable disease resistance protein At1g12290 [Prosopis cineraria]|uniref:probable disease resistance protein At1g12290 n=1 Tax=Prosopis cineraria TaxID=364024 RepID=UPI002410B63B|nr:probable disease resistance protein At1g12290 [Prosopis cineraria]